MQLLAVLTIIALSFTSLGVSCARHGKPKTGKENGWISFVSMVIFFTLLWMTGVFEVFVK